MMFFFWKAPEVSFEHFSKHYAHIHSDLTVGAKSFGAFNVQRYTQVSIILILNFIRVLHLLHPRYTPADPEIHRSMPCPR